MVVRRAAVHHGNRRVPIQVGGVWPWRSSCLCFRLSLKTKQAAAGPITAPALPHPTFTHRCCPACRRQGDDFLKPNQRLNAMLQRVLRADYAFPPTKQLR